MVRGHLSGHVNRFVGNPKLLNLKFSARYTCYCHSHTCTSSLLRYELELPLETLPGVLAPFMELATPPADVGVPLRLVDELLETIVPAGGGVPGMTMDDVMPATGFWSRDTRDCCNPIGWSMFPTEDGVMVPVPWICV